MTQTVELNREPEPRGPPPDPLIGRVLLHYRVLEPIGQGGMSVVYRGRDEHLARDVAIKVLHPFLAEKPECRARLAREARAVARLEHPNIVKVFDFSGERPTLEEKPGKNDDENALRRDMPTEGFIVAELVKGPTLKRFAEKHALWRCPEVGALVVWQLLQALQHAHDNGVVHRDLKPENVMVRDDGVLKLMDFGIAQIADQTGLTVTGTLLGSPAHMAPECIDGHPADERSDLFSVGTVLYWITTGSLPFEALTPHALLKLIVEGKAPPPQQKSPRVSDDLARIIGRSLSTKPADRYGSAREFADALRECLEKSGLVVDSASLRATLAGPTEAVPVVAARVREAFLARARKHLEEGATARALACLNRVLADDPADADARALLDRLDADDDGPGADIGPGEITDPAAPLPPAPGAVEAALLAPPPTAAGAPRGVRWQSALIAVAAVGLVVLAVAVSRAIDDASQTRTTPTTTAIADPPTTGPDVSEIEEDGKSIGEPASSPSPSKVKKKKRVALREVIPVTPVTPNVTESGAATMTSTNTTHAGTGRKVVFRVAPWADIVVDGAVVARNKQAWETELSFGSHQIVFQNPRAKDHEVRITVEPTGPDPVVAARLEPRPALLVVRANESDAFVDVDGSGGKPVHETESRPLVVPLASSREEREVFIYKKGFVAYRRRHAFSAGETLRLDVVLEPDVGDPSPASPGP